MGLRRSTTYRKVRGIGSSSVSSQLTLIAEERELYDERGMTHREEEEARQKMS